MKRQYSEPQLLVARMTAVSITTVSADTEWDDAWSDALEEEDNA